MTDLGRAYHIRCRYKNREAAIKSSVVNSSKPDEQNFEANPSSEGSDRRDHGRSISKVFVF